MSELNTRQIFETVNHGWNRVCTDLDKAKYEFYQATESFRANPSAKNYRKLELSALALQVADSNLNDFKQNHR